MERSGLAGELEQIGMSLWREQRRAREHGSFTCMAEVCMEDWVCALHIEQAGSAVQARDAWNIEASAGFMGLDGCRRMVDEE